MTPCSKGKYRKGSSRLHYLWMTSPALLQYNLIYVSMEIHHGMGYNTVVKILDWSMEIQCGMGYSTVVKILDWSMEIQHEMGYSTLVKMLDWRDQDSIGFHDCLLPLCCAVPCLCLSDHAVMWVPGHGQPAMWWFNKEPGSVISWGVVQYRPGQHWLNIRKSCSLTHKIHLHPILLSVIRNACSGHLLVA